MLNQTWHAEDGEKSKEKKYIEVLMMAAFAGYFAYVTWSGFKDKSLAFKGQSFSREAKPFFYWALLFMSAFLTFAGSSGLQDLLTTTKHIDPLLEQN